MSRRRKSHQRHKDRFSKDKNTNKADNRSPKNEYIKVDSIDTKTNQSSVKTQKKKPEIPSLTCSVCGELISDVYTAIAHKDNGEPIHFDCAVNMIKQSEPLGKDEELCYLGNGAFAIVIRKQPPSPVRFFIKKRIEFEPRDKAVWKNNLSVNLLLDI